MSGNAASLKLSKLGEKRRVGEPNKKRKVRIGRKQFILLIVSVCLVALIAEAVLLVHSFSKKKKPDVDTTQLEEPKTYVKQTVRRVSKASHLINGEEYRTIDLAYDEYGRVIRAEYKENGSIYSKARSYTYLQGGCGLVVHYEGIRGEYLECGNYFFRESPIEAARFGVGIIDYDVDGSGRLKKVTSDGWNYYKFDKKGRPVQYCVSDENGNKKIDELYWYDDSGRLEKIVSGGGYTTDIIYDSNEGAIIYYKRPNGELYFTRTYSGKNMICEKKEEKEEESAWCSRYYYPKNTDLLPGVDEVLEDLFGTFSLQDMLPGVEEFTSLDGKERYEPVKVEFTEDGQPLQNFYSDGTLQARYIYDENGRVSGYRKDLNAWMNDREPYILGWDFTYDEIGNLVAIIDSNKLYSFQFEWTEMEALVEQE